MELRILASTKIGHQLDIKDAIRLSGLAAGICYLPDSIDSLLEEPLTKTNKRSQLVLESMHHSVFGHPTYNLLLINVPKILCMVINNEKAYTASEKSARYTKMKTSHEEQTLYEKWTEIFIDKILTRYPKLGKIAASKLAMENARYLISVFTPATTILYTVSLQQLNYILSEMLSFKPDPSDNFGMKLQQVFADFIKLISNEGLKVDKLNPGPKNWQLSLFANHERVEEFGENYSVNYQASFAYLAQAQRHRTLSYEMSIPAEPQFYLPPFLLTEPDLASQWKADIASLKDFYPQGMIVNINERGTYENLIKKCQERLCGQAQLEIAHRTFAILEQYTKNTSSPFIRQELTKYKAAKCQILPDFNCTKPCLLGPEHFVDRDL